MQLYNNLSAKERAELIETAGKERLTISFYKYAKIGNTEIFRNHLFIAWDEQDVAKALMRNFLYQLKISKP